MPSCFTPYIAKRLTWALTLGLFSTVAHGSIDSNALDQALKFHHTEDVLGTVYIRFEDALTRHRKDDGVTETQLRRLALIGKRIFQAKNLLKTFSEAYARLISPRDLGGLLAWQRSPLGLRFGQGLTDFYRTPTKKIDAYFAKHSVQTLKTNRKNAMKTFLRAQEQDQLYVRLEFGAELGVLLGLSGYAPINDREKSNKIIDEAQSLKVGYSGKNQERWMTTNFYVLRDLRNDEIDDISKFAMSATGQEHTKAFLKALDATLEAAGKTLRDQVIKEATPAKL